MVCPHVLGPITRYPLPITHCLLPITISQYPPLVSFEYGFDIDNQVDTRLAFSLCYSGIARSCLCEGVCPSTIYRDYRCGGISALLHRFGHCGRGELKCPISHSFWACSLSCLTEHGLYQSWLIVHHGPYSAGWKLTSSSLIPAHVPPLVVYPVPDRNIHLPLPPDLGTLLYRFPTHSRPPSLDSFHLSMDRPVHRTRGL
jgi:hypothetical protein